MILASTFSSKMKAAIVNSKNPMAIDQKVRDALDIFLENFLVAIIEMAKLSDEARVKKVPNAKSELKSRVRPLVVEIRIAPPTIPKLNAMYFRVDNFSLRMIRPNTKTAKGEVSMIAADKLDGMYFNPANCIG